jgi:hypothetical protein
MQINALPTAAGQHVQVGGRASSRRLRVHGKPPVASDNLNPLRNDAVEAAITRVLESEVAARAAVTAARAQATEIAEGAREAARRRALHTDRRIRRIRAAFATKTTAEVDNLEAQAAALGVTTALTPAEVAQVDAAVAALARALTETSP